MQLPDGKELNHSQKLLVAKSIFMTFFRALNDEGKQIYVFYAVNGAHLTEVNRMIESGRIESAKLDEYGQIVAADYGEPSEEVKQMMAEEYNFNLDVLEDPNAPPSMVEF